MRRIAIFFVLLSGCPTEIKVETNDLGRIECKTIANDTICTNQEGKVIRETICVRKSMWDVFCLDCDCHIL